MSVNPKLGVYRVFWRSGGESVASIYMDAAGQKWIAPSNWIAPGMLSASAKDIERLEKIMNEDADTIVDRLRAHYEMTKPPVTHELAILVDVPFSDRRDRCDDIAEAYAVEVGDGIPGGCIIWGRHRGQWHPNVSARWLLSKFIAGSARMLHSEHSGGDDWWIGWGMVRHLIEVQSPEGRVQDGTTT